MLRETRADTFDNKEKVADYSAGAAYLMFWRFVRSANGKEQTMDLNELYNRIAAKADTAGTQINAAETRRVLATFFDVLEDLSVFEATEVISRGLKEARERRR